MKKSVYLAIFALTFGLCAGCGNKEADSDISGTEDTVPVKRILISNQPILRRSILRAIILRTSKKMWTM